MTLAAEISSLRARIRARKGAKPPRTTFELEARLRLLVIEQLASEIAAAQRSAARERREPGSFQRELELDE